jgi:hypothetical protein
MRLSSMIYRVVVGVVREHDQQPDPAPYRQAAHDIELAASCGRLIDVGVDPRLQRDFDERVAVLGVPLVTAA